MDLNAESMRLERLSVPELQAEYAGLSERERPSGGARRRRATPSFVIAQNFRLSLRISRWIPLGCVA